MQRRASMTGAGRSSRPSSASGGARLHAAGAGAAVVALERLVVGELHVERTTPRKKYDPLPRLDEHRVAAEPAEPGALGQLALQHGPGVDVGTVDPLLKLDQRAFIRSW
jgi:hypothetical protein